MHTQPHSERTDAGSAGGLAAAAIKSWAIQIQPAERRSVGDSVRAIATKPRLALRAGRALKNDFSRLRLHHHALQGTRHGFRFLETQTDQIVGAPFDRCNVGAISRSGGVLNDQLDPHLHIDSLRLTRARSPQWDAIKFQERDK